MDEGDGGFGDLPEGCVICANLRLGRGGWRAEGIGAEGFIWSGWIMLVLAYLKRAG